MKREKKEGGRKWRKKNPTEQQKETFGGNSRFTEVIEEGQGWEKEKQMPSVKASKIWGMIKSQEGLRELCW